MREFLEILRDQTKEERLHNTWFSACGLQRFSKVRGSLKSRCNLIGNCFVIPHDTIPSTVMAYSRKNIIGKLDQK